MKARSILVIGALAFMLAGADELNTGLEYIDQSADKGATVNWTKHTVRVKGNGFGPETVKDLGRRKVLSKRAALVDAQRNFIETIQGVRVTSNTTVKDLMLENDVITSQAEGMVKGLRLVDVSYTDDGGCEVTCEVDLNEQGEFLLSALNAAGVKVTDNYPRFDWVALRKELEDTKANLSRTQAQLSSTRSDLRATKGELFRTTKDLTDTKQQYAALKDSFEKAQVQLAETNTRLIRAEEKLNYMALRETDLKQALEATNTELSTTKQILDGLRNELGNSRVTMAVQEKEISLTREYLAEKKTELNRLSTQLSRYSGADAASSPIDRTALQDYIQQLRQIQEDARDRVQAINSSSSSASSGGSEYTGLLIDARGKGAKPALSPNFLSEKGERLFDLASQAGTAMVDYLKGKVENAVNYPKVAGNPLVVKPLQILNGTDIVLSQEDIENIAPLLDKVVSGSLAVLL